MHSSRDLGLSNKQKQLLFSKRQLPIFREKYNINNNFYFFKKWRHLPDRMPKEKIHLFANKMATISSDRMRQLLDSLSRFKQRAEETKKCAVSRLGLKTNGVLKSAFDRWNFDQPGTALNR